MEGMSQKQVYMPPEAEITHLKDFDLSKIEETFQYASFERRISKRKVHLIAQAVMDNKFTDNVLRVVKTNPAKFEVLDGQHRIEGLRYARDEFGLQTYELILFCYLGGNRREIYRRLNLIHTGSIINRESKVYRACRKTPSRMAGSILASLSSVSFDPFSSSF